MRSLLTLIGLMAAALVLGAVLLVSLPFVLMGSIQASGRHQRELLREFDVLHTRIAEHVDSVDGEVVSWDDLRAADVITRTDRRLCKKLGVEYYPVSAKSPDKSLMFVRSGKHRDTRYYRDPKIASGHSWTAPDQRSIVVSDRRPGTYLRDVTLRDTKSDRSLYALTAKAVIRAHWRRDSQFVVIEYYQPNDDVKVAILFVGDGDGREVVLPEQVDPRRYLLEYDASFDHEWHNQSISFDEWDADGMKLECKGGIWVKQGDTMLGRATFCIRLTLAIENDLKARVVHTEEVYRGRSGPDGWRTEKYNVP